MVTDYGEIDSDDMVYEDAITSGEEVKEEDKALHGDLCEMWEH